VRRRLGRLLADVGPLRDSPLYRGLFAGQTVSAMGTQITAIALAYQVYALTRSTFDVGLLGVAVLVPLVLVGLLGGSLVDAVDRRRLVLITSSVMATSSVLLAVQAFTGAARVWPLYLLAALTGGASALDQPARSTFIPRLLGTEQVAAASALGQLSMNLSLTGGPLLGGLLIAGPGLGWAYSVDAVSFAAALAAVVRLPAMRPDGASVRPGLRATAEGLAWVRRHPVVMMTFLVDIDAMVFGMPRALFPAMAATRYGGGGTTLGLLSAAPAVGAVVAAVLSGPLSRVGRQGRGVLVSVAVWGAAIAGFGLTGSLGAGLGFLAVAGAADMVSGVFRSTILLTAAPTSCAAGCRASSSSWWPADRASVTWSRGARPRSSASAPPPGPAACSAWPASPRSPWPSPPSRGTTPRPRPVRRSATSPPGCWSSWPRRRPSRGVLEVEHQGERLVHAPQLVEVQ